MRRHVLFGAFCSLIRIQTGLDTTDHFLCHLLSFLSFSPTLSCPGASCLQNPVSSWTPASSWALKVLSSVEDMPGRGFGEGSPLCAKVCPFVMLVLQSRLSWSLPTPKNPHNRGLQATLSWLRLQLSGLPPCNRGPVKMMPEHLHPDSASGW